MAVSDYRKMLLRLCDEITSGELERLKFLCDDFIPLRTMERINNMMNLVTELERQKKLDDTNLITLRDLLKQIKRSDLVTLLDKFAFGFSDGEDFAVWKPVKVDGKMPRKSKQAVRSALQQWGWDQLVTDSDGGKMKNTDYNSSKERDIMLKDVTADVFEELGKCLNPRSSNNWMLLAGKLGFRMVEVANFNLEPKNSTQEMLRSWSTNAGATVMVLHRKLLNIGRSDAAEILEPYLA